MKSTKETQDLKEEVARQEQIKEAAKKRAEKAADIEARKRIKAKIEADKEERRRKAEEAKAAREGKAPPSVAAAGAQASTSAAAAVPKPTTSHNETRIRFQMATGTTQKSFGADTTLFEVAQALEAEHGITVNKFEMTFPRKVFEGSMDFSKTLREAGLIPSAVLRVQ